MAGVLRCNQYQLSVPPAQFVFQLPSELVLRLVEYGAVQSGFLFNHFTRIVFRTFGGLGHIAYFQIFDIHGCVVLANRVADLMQEILSDVGNPMMQLADFSNQFFSIIAAFGFPF